MEAADLDSIGTKMSLTYPKVLMRFLIFLGIAFLSETNYSRALGKGRVKLYNSS